MNKIFTVLCFLLFIFASFSSNASHVVGGDVEYECIGPRTWKVRLTIYRDCTGAALCGSMACSQNMSVRPNTALNPTGCAATPNSVSFTLQLIKVEDISKSVKDLCGNSAKNGCTNLGQVIAGPYSPSVEKYIFEGTLNLSTPTLDNSNCKYWDISWDLCCRNVGIWNLANSSSQDFKIGATIDIFHQSNNTFKNNSPIFKNEPVITVCANQEIVYNIGCVDPDGDLLTYHISPSLKSDGTSVIYQAPGSPTYPFPLNANQPPHVNYPQSNGPYVIIDSLTGFTSFNGINNTSSTISGNINLVVKQWNNDSVGAPYLVGITQREVQILLINCAANIPPKLVSTNSLPGSNTAFKYEVEEGQQLCFTVTAIDSNVSALFGVDTTYISWDSSLVRPGKLTFGPTYTVGSGQPRPREDQWQFCWQTDSTEGRDLPYTFTVTAIDKACPSVGKVTQAFNILVKGTPLFGSTKTALPCGKKVYNLYKNKHNTTINAATIQIANSPNDRNFVNGYRTITTINKNPSATPGDTLNQPRLMFADTFTYLAPGKYYVRMYYTTPNTNFTPSFIDSIVVNNNNIFAFISTNKTPSICEGDSIMFSSLAVQPNYKYTWFLNNNDYTNEKQSYLWAIGSGVYKLLINDTLNNCSAYSNEITMQVNPYPSAVLSVTPKVACLTGNNFYVLNNTTISSGSYTSVIDYGDGNTRGSLQWHNINYIDTGTYLMKLSAVSNFGCRSYDSTYVRVIDIPKVDINAVGPTLVCFGKTTELAGAYYPNLQYKWYKDDVFLNAKDTNTLTTNQDGAYHLTVTDNIACSHTSKKITVDIIPGPKAIFEINDTLQCVNNNMFFTKNLSTYGFVNDKFYWYWSNRVDSTNKLGVSITYPSAGVFPIKLKIKTVNGWCVDSMVKMVRTTEPTSVSNITGPTNNLSTNETYGYKINRHNNHTYHWNVINGNILNGQGTDSIAVQWLTPGSGQVEAILFSPNGCADTTHLETDILNNHPFITGLSALSGTTGSTVLIYGGNFNQVNQVAFGGVNARSFTISSSTLIAAIVDTGATGNVTVTTPSGIARYWLFTYNPYSGLQEINNQEFSVYPNPVNDEIIIESDNTLNNIRFELMDLNGKVFINTTSNSLANKHTLDVKKLGSGVYFLRITSQAHTKIVKVVKQ
jgi:hypothetical protein